MKAWPLLGISLMQAFLFLAHWFIFHTIVVFWGDAGLAATLALRSTLYALAFSFIAAALLSFLQRAQANGARIVLVVTGKGTGASSLGRDPEFERGVLKRRVPLWLALPEFRPLVVGFEDAHAGHGGQGALYVRLRRER